MLENQSKNESSYRSSLHEEIAGYEQLVPLLDGSLQRYINFDNAASTPAFKIVQEKVNEAIQWYSSVHRGAGLKSLLCTELYEQSRGIVEDFVGADKDDCVIFCMNTSEAINRLANCLTLKEDEIILTTVMEHHSNDLPYRPKGKVVHVAVEEDGSLSLEKFKIQLEQYRERVKLVAVSGASNVSGFVTPIHELAELAHRYGAKIFVDCAQLAPHRPIQMGKRDDPSRLDFIALSAHKMYAPFGSGALVGAKEFFAQVPPDYRGGGTIEVVTLDEVHWADPPERNEAGSPNVIGAIALATSMRKISEIGMHTIAAHEAELTAYTLDKMNRIPKIKIYGSHDPQRLADRLGVITFEVHGLPHGKVAAILSFEGGIAVRDGCFCAHPYVLELLGISQNEFEVFKHEAIAHNRSRLPGMVRASFGCYNTIDEVDHFIEVLHRIIDGDYIGDYLITPSSGSYTPRNFKPQVFESYFQL